TSGTQSGHHRSSRGEDERVLGSASSMRAVLCADLQQRSPMPRNNSVSTAAGKNVTYLMTPLSPSKSTMAGSTAQARRTGRLAGGLTPPSSNTAAQARKANATSQSSA